MMEIVYKVVERTDVPDVFQSVVPFKQLYPLHKETEGEFPFFVFLTSEDACKFQAAHPGTVIAECTTPLRVQEAPQITLSDKLLVASLIRRFWDDYSKMPRQNFHDRYRDYSQLTVLWTYTVNILTITKIIEEERHAYGV